LYFIDLLTHLDAHVKAWAHDLGGWLYVILFAIIFAETGLVVTPFLPGDSLLFTVGVIAALEGSINVWAVIPLLVVAAVLGDAVNYSVGKLLGPAVFTSERSLLFNKKHLYRTQAFYERYGGKTIIIARFIPIIRTFAPFVAGIGKMHFGRFQLFNIAGGTSWVLLFIWGGYLFGNIPVIKQHFGIVTIAIIVVSVMPAAIAFFRRGK